MDINEKSVPKLESLYEPELKAYSDLKPRVSKHFPQYGLCADCDRNVPITIHGECSICLSKQVIIFENKKFWDMYNAQLRQEEKEYNSRENDFPPEALHENATENAYNNILSSKVQNIIRSADFSKFSDQIDWIVKEIDWFNDLKNKEDEDPTYIKEALNNLLHHLKSEYDFLESVYKNLN